MTRPILLRGLMNVVDSLISPRCSLLDGCNQSLPQLMSIDPRCLLIPAVETVCPAEETIAPGSLKQGWVIDGPQSIACD